MKFNLNYPHPADQPWWYRFMLAIWMLCITISATFAVVLTIWFLTEHGSYTTEEAEAISFAFELLSMGVTLGFALAAFQFIGPNWIQRLGGRFRAYLGKRVRGVWS